MKTYGVMDVQIHIFLPRNWLEVSGQLHALAALPPGKRAPRYPLDGRLRGPQIRFGRRGENSWPYRDSNSDPLGRPARSQSLYRLRYPGSYSYINRKWNFLTCEYEARTISAASWAVRFLSLCVWTWKRRRFRSGFSDHWDITSWFLTGDARTKIEWWSLSPYSPQTEYLSTAVTQQNST
jgi:hypothetical protein